MSNFKEQATWVDRFNNYPELEDKKQSGFFPLPKINICKHREHKPPMHIHIPQGQGYRHICPGCGNITDLIPLQITL